MAETACLSSSYVSHMDIVTQDRVRRLLSVTPCNPYLRDITFM